MTTSNSSDPVSDGTVTSAASASETPSQMSTPSPTPAAPSASAPAMPTGLDALKAKAEAALPDPNKGVKPDAMPGAPGAVVPPGFAPNWKYKAFGKEREIDEFWRPLVKDAETEKKVKDIFTQAHAFEDMKLRHEGTAKEFQGLLDEYQALDKDVKKVMSFRNNRDFDNFFQALRISDQEIYEYVSRKLALQDGSPEQRQLAQQHAQDRMKNYEMSEENEKLQRQYQQQAVQARTMQLDNVLSRSDVSRAASLFDEKSGRIGAFRDIVIDEARNHYYATGGDNGGKDLSAEEATQMVMQKWGKFFETSQASSEVPQMIAPVPQVQAKPVIPAPQGKGASPIKKAPKSLDDLKAMAKAAQRA